MPVSKVHVHVHVLEKSFLIDRLWGELPTSRLDTSLSLSQHWIVNNNHYTCLSFCQCAQMTKIKLDRNLKGKNLYRQTFSALQYTSTCTYRFLSSLPQIAMFCQREVRRWALKSQRLSKEVSTVVPRARRIMREMLVHWKKHEKVEKEQRRKAEKEAVEQQRLVDEMREVCVKEY